MAVTSRPRRGARRAPTRWRRFRERFVIDDPRPDLPRRQLARPPAGRHPRAPARRRRPVGRRARVAAGTTGSTRPRGSATRSRPACSARAPGEVLVCDSTTVNLYKLACAALDARAVGAAIAGHRPRQLPDRPLRARGHRAARGLRAAAVRRRPADGPQPPRPRGVLPTAPSPGRARHVAYRSGALADMEALTDVARRTTRASSGTSRTRPARCRSTLRRRRRRARRRLHLQVPQRRPGRPGLPVRRGGAAGAAALADPGLVRPGRPVRDGAPLRRRRPGSPASSPGTPPILGLAPSRRASALTAEAGIEALRAKSIALTELLIALHDEWLAPLGFELGSPRDPARRGSHVSLRHPEAWPICRALIERAARDPGLPRAGLRPARRRAALHPLRRRVGRARPPARLVERGEQREVDAARARVT